MSCLWLILCAIEHTLPTKRNILRGGRYIAFIGKAATTRTFRAQAMILGGRSPIPRVPGPCLSRGTLLGHLDVKKRNRWHVVAETPKPV